MNQDWSIQHRADRCAVSGEPFRDGDAFYTLLYSEKGEFRREDLSEAAFKAHQQTEHYARWKREIEDHCAVPRSSDKFSTVFPVPYA